MKPPTESFDIQAFLALSQAAAEHPLMNHRTLWDNGFLVRLFDGPTTPGRADFHINQVPELFYQLAGTLDLRLWDGERFVDHCIGPGEVYSLPALVPHRNRRPEGSVGLVVHVTRTPEQTDAILWYCEACAEQHTATVLHRVDYSVNALRENLRTHIRAFLADSEQRTCGVCGTVASAEQGAM